MRKASAETRLRYARAKLRSITVELFERRRVGAQLANIAFNLAQRETNPLQKEILDQMQKNLGQNREHSFMKMWRPSKKPGYISQMIDRAKAAGTFERECTPAEKRAYRMQSRRLKRQTKGKRLASMLSDYGAQP